MKLAVVTVVLLAAVPALAAPDPVEQQVKRKQAEQLEKAGHFDEAGAAYLDLYNADPQDKRVVELLYNAGVCFEQGRSISAALQAYELLLRSFPNDSLAPRALARVGTLYASIAMYDRAADKLEQYAKKYASQRDAYQALSDAVFYRKASGDHERAIANTHQFVKMFGAKRPNEAAEAMWSLISIYERQADVPKTIDHLRSYLRIYGAKGGAGRVVIAHAKLGQLLWQQSCPVPLVDGLCVKRGKPQPARCDRPASQPLTAVAQNQKQRADALAAFALATKEFERQGSAVDEPVARYFYSRAKLAIADAELHAYLGAPDEKRGGELDRKYEGVLAIRDSATSIAAAARLGLVTQYLANATAARSKDCKVVAKSAAPLDARTAEAYGVCLAKSTELGWFDESSKRCEHELARLRPTDFPAATERRADALHVAPIVVSEPPP